MFETLEKAPADPIFGLKEAFKADPNANKVDLTAGIYCDESGRTPIFAAVKTAERRLLEREDTKSYLPISGSPEYAAAVQGLLFGADHEIVTSGRAATVQAPGGTGALRVAADLLRRLRPDATLWLSDPTWTNHRGVFQAAGFQVKDYPYYDRNARRLRLDEMIESVRSMPETDIILLYGCCHNPTGLDPTPAEWERIAAAVAERGPTPVIDLAYQGFGRGLDEDAAATRLLCQARRDALIASSCSKNFALYNERVGALTAVCQSDESAHVALSHLKIVIRRNYSNPPSHGSAIVAAVLADPALRTQWQAELADVRRRIQHMRRLFVDTLKAKGVDQDFSSIIEQNGMFSYSGLNQEQVDALRERHSVYLLASGRMNVAGLNGANIDYVCTAEADVL